MFVQEAVESSIAQSTNTSGSTCICYNTMANMSSFTDVTDCSDVILPVCHTNYTELSSNFRAVFCNYDIVVHAFG